MGMSGASCASPSNPTQLSRRPDHWQHQPTTPPPASRSPWPTSVSCFFAGDDERVRELATQYREGELLSGELEDLAAERIAEFLRDHQRRRAELGSPEEELPAYRLTPDERQRALRRVGFPDDAVAVERAGD